MWYLLSFIAGCVFSFWFWIWVDSDESGGVVEEKVRIMKACQNPELKPDSVQHFGDIICLEEKRWMVYRN
ncbi:MAG: hypothetical protein ABJ387_03570 [Balneola sp.]